MTEQSGQVVFFDLDGTLGSPRISFPEARLERLDVYPFATPVLQRLNDAAIPAGIISNTGNETAESMRIVLEASGIYGFFRPDLMIFSSVVGMDKSSIGIFKLASQRAAKMQSPDRCIYVGEDRLEREMAMKAGFRVCPHPLLVEEVLRNQPLRYVRISIPESQSRTEWRNSLKAHALVPLYVEREHSGTALYAITTAPEATKLDDLGFHVVRLGVPNAPLTTNLYLFRDDRQVMTGFLAPEGNSARFFGQGEGSEWVLASSARGLFVALPAGRSVDELRFRDAAHGSVAKLLPDMTLLEPFGQEVDARRAPFLFTPPADRTLTQDERDAMRDGITAQVITNDVNRYTGVDSVTSTGVPTRIRSRHIGHPDNVVATRALAEDLRLRGGPGMAVRLHQFLHQGRTLFNVEGELLGSNTDEMVLVCAHFDSTASDDMHYDPLNDPAPGADDDASGAAAVLAIAEIFGKLAAPAKPKRSIRFVLFNSEEHALAGSAAYARDQSALNVPIVAVYQMDMIGYNVKDPRSFEIHAGCAASADVERRSVTLAENMERLRQNLALNLEPAQIYPNRASGNSGEDPADGRSDHGSFHLRGYSACAISEDYFAGPQSGSPGAEPNPNYHSKQDTFVDAAYAADITKLVAAAAWVAANA
jgi:bacterial leucyl aminopeptidase